jgi:hypothetical protein
MEGTMRLILSLVMFVGVLGLSGNVFAYQDDQQVVSSEETMAADEVFDIESDNGKRCSSSLSDGYCSGNFVGGECNTGFNRGVCLSTGKYAANKRPACRCR